MLMFIMTRVSSAASAPLGTNISLLTTGVMYVSTCVYMRYAIDYTRVRLVNHADKNMKLDTYSHGEKRDKTTSPSVFGLICLPKVIK